MMNSWWLVWMVVMILFFASPVGYGWGYRKWGPPYPRYIQRRRVQHAASAGGSTMYSHEAWGWRGDFVWVVLLVGVFWAVAALWSR